MLTGWRFCLGRARCRKCGFAQGELPDQREPLQFRIFFVSLRKRVKNRHHRTLSRHNVHVPGADLLGVGPRGLPELPQHSREAIEEELVALDFLEVQI